VSAVSRKEVRERRFEEGRKATVMSAVPSKEVGGRKITVVSAVPRKREVG
jgi:hypothetical protein